MGVDITLVFVSLLVWSLIAPALVAIGSTVRRNTDAASAFFVGFAVCVPLLIAYHFLAAINLLPFLILCGVGLLWIGRNWRQIRLSRLQIVLAIAAAVFSSRYALQADDALYHLQLVQWYSHYAAVPGLANLHTRFGFNSSYYVFAALFRGLPGGASHYPAGLLWLATFISLSRSRFGRLLLLPLCLWFGFVSALSNDFVILCLTLIVGSQLFEGVNGKKLDMGALVLVVFAGMTVKLSFAAFGLTALIAAAYLTRFPFRRLVAISLAGTPVFLVWMAHGVILSGYPLYPLIVGAFNVDWRLPFARANDEYAWIWSWARMPGVRPDQVPADWLVTWLERAISNLDFVFPLVFGVIFLPLALKRRLRFLFFLPVLVGLTYWFGSAPDIRFGAGLLWLLGLGIVGFAIPVRFDRIVKYGLVIVCLALLPLNIAPVENTTVDFRVVEVDGNPIKIVEGTDRCFDLPLPCTPYMPLVEQLEFRDPRQLGAGFRSRDFE